VKQVVRRNYRRAPAGHVFDPTNYKKLPPEEEVADQLQVSRVDVKTLFIVFGGKNE